MKIETDKQSLPEPLRAATAHIVAGELAKAEAILRPYVHDNPVDVNGIRMLGEVGLSLGALRDAERLRLEALHH